MFVEVFSNFVEGHVKGQLVASRYLDPEQVRHWLLAAPLQVAHSAWQASQVLVVEFSKTLVAPQDVGQVDPSRNLPLGQLEHSEFKLPVHSAQSP